MPAEETLWEGAPALRLAAIAFVLVMVGRRIGGLIWRGLDALRGLQRRWADFRPCEIETSIGTTKIPRESALVQPAGG
jgi:hypothetical protein